MTDRPLYELGRTFYEWHKEGKVQFEYGSSSCDLELDIERVIGLIEYVQNKKTALQKS